MQVYKKLLLLIFTTALFSNTVIAQWHANVYFNQAYDSNPFRVPEPEESWVSTFDIGIQRNFKKISMSYTGSFSRFQNMMDRNHYWHQLALFGSSSKTRWGIYAEQRLNNTDFEVYNYISYNGYINQQFNIATININWAADLEISDYQQLNEIDNLQIGSSLRLNKSFPTRTTFILGGIINFKKYVNSLKIVESQEMQQLLSVFDGPRKGFGGQDGYTIYSEIEAPSVSQLILWVRLAQSVTSTTGLAVQYQTSTLLSGNNRDVAGISYGYSEESQIFDDPMGYESSSIGSELTQLLPLNVLLKGAYYYTKKKYSSQGIYVGPESYDDATLRDDRYNTYWLRIQKSFALSSTRNTNLLVRLNYQWTDNYSNSYWYNYKNQYTAMAIEFQF